jgi:5-methylcytosine-specific restriction enzyme A
VTRKRILSRDKGLCQVCLKVHKYRPARAVDHIIPKFEGGDDDDDNLQAICKDCHDAKTAEESARARRG